MNIFRTLILAVTLSLTTPTFAQTPVTSSTSFEEWEIGRVQIGEVSIVYRKAGSGPPLILLHGWPQHSLMWHTIGPILAQHFTVIAPDQRGAGMSTITADGYDKSTMAADLKGLIDHLGYETIGLVGYDHGAGTAAAFARDYPKRVTRVAFMEYALAGFGYESVMTPKKEWTLYSNWHLSLFTVPDAAEWMLKGQERELLSWFFYHAAYSGNSSVAPEHFEAYVREISKPGALRAGISYYANVWQDAEDNAVLNDHPLPMPVLALGGESSAGPYGETLYAKVVTELTVISVPRAGHWLGDENPEASAKALATFFLGGNKAE